MGYSGTAGGGSHSSSLRRIRSLSAPWGKARGFTAAAYNPGTGELLVGGLGGLQLWSPQRLARSTVQPRDESEAPVCAGCIGLLGMWAVVYPGAVRILDSKLTLRLKIACPSPKSRLTSVSVVPEAPLVICGSEDGKLFLFSLGWKGHRLGFSQQQVVASHADSRSVLHLSIVKLEGAPTSKLACLLEGGVVNIYRVEATSFDQQDLPTYLLTEWSALHVDHDAISLSYSHPYLVPTCRAGCSLSIYCISDSSDDSHPVAGTLQLPCNISATHIYREADSLLSVIAGCEDGCVRHFLLEKSDQDLLISRGIFSCHRVGLNPVTVVLSEASQACRRACISASNDCIAVLEAVCPAHHLVSPLTQPTQVTRAGPSGESMYVLGSESRAEITRVETSLSLSPQTTGDDKGGGTVGLVTARVPFFCQETAGLRCIAAMSGLHSLELACGFTDGSLMLIRTTDGLAVSDQISRHGKGTVSTAPITSLTSHDSMVASGDADGQICLYLVGCQNVPGNPPKHALAVHWHKHIHSGTVHSLLFCKQWNRPGHYRLLSSCRHLISVISVDYSAEAAAPEKMPHVTLFARCTSTTSPIYSMTGILLGASIVILAGCSGGLVRAWKLDAEEPFGSDQKFPVWERQMHTAYVTTTDSFLATGSGSLALTAASDHTLCVYLLQQSGTAVPVHRLSFPFPHSVDAPLRAAFMRRNQSEDALIIASCSAINTTTGRDVFCVAFSYCVRKGPRGLGVHVAARLFDDSCNMTPATQAHFSLESKHNMLTACSKRLLEDGENISQSPEESSRISDTVKEEEDTSNDDVKTTGGSLLGSKSADCTMTRSKSYRDMRRSALRCEFNSMGEKVYVNVPLAPSTSGILPMPEESCRAAPLPSVHWASRSRLNISAPSEPLKLASQVIGTAPRIFRSFWSKQGLKNLETGNLPQLAVLSMAETAATVRTILLQCFAREVGLESLVSTVYRYFIHEYGSNVGEAALHRLLASILYHENRDALLRVFSNLLQIDESPTATLLNPHTLELLYSAAHWLSERGRSKPGKPIMVTKFQAEMCCRHFMEPEWGRGNAAIEQLQEFIRGHNVDWVCADDLLDRIQCACSAVDAAFSQAAATLFAPYEERTLSARPRSILSDPVKACGSEEIIGPLVFKPLLEGWIRADSDRTGSLPASEVQRIGLQVGPWAQSGATNVLQDDQHVMEKIVSIFEDPLDGTACYLDVWIHIFAAGSSGIISSCPHLRDVLSAISSREGSAELQRLGALLVYLQTYRCSRPASCTERVSSALQGPAFAKSFFVQQQAADRGPGTLSLTKPFLRKSASERERLVRRDEYRAALPHPPKPLEHSSHKDDAQALRKAEIALKSLVASAPADGHQLRDIEQEWEPPLIHLDSGLALLPKQKSIKCSRHRTLTTHYVRCPFLRPIRSSTRYMVLSGSSPSASSMKSSKAPAKVKESLNCAEVCRAPTRPQSGPMHPLSRDERVDTATLSFQSRIDSRSCGARAPEDLQTAPNSQPGKVPAQTQIQSTNTFLNNEVRVSSRSRFIGRSRESSRHSKKAARPQTLRSEDSSSESSSIGSVDQHAGRVPPSVQAGSYHAKVTQQDLVRAMLRENRMRKQSPDNLIATLVHEEAERKKRQKEAEIVARLAAESAKIEAEQARRQATEERRKALEAHQTQLDEEKFRREEAERLRREDMIQMRRMEEENRQREEAERKRLEENAEAEAADKRWKAQVEAEAAAAAALKAQAEAERQVAAAKARAKVAADEALLISAEVLAMDSNDVDADILIKEASAALERLLQAERKTRDAVSSTLADIIELIMQDVETAAFADEDKMCITWQTLWRAAAPVQSCKPRSGERVPPRTTLGGDGTPIDVELWTPRCFAGVTESGELTMSLAHHHNNVRYQGTSLIRPLSERRAKALNGRDEESYLDDGESDSLWMSTLRASLATNSLSDLFKSDSFSMAAYFPIVAGAGATVSWARLTELLEERHDLFCHTSAASMSDSPSICAEEKQLAERKSILCASPSASTHAMGSQSGRQSFLASLRKRSRLLEPFVPFLVAGMPRCDTVSHGQWKFFRFALSPQGANIISLSALRGDPDVFVSIGALPSLAEHHWKSTKYFDVDEISIDPKSPGCDSNSHYFVGVTSSCGDASFRVALNVQRDQGECSMSMQRAAAIIHRLTILSSFDTDRLLQDFAGASLESRRQQLQEGNAALVMEDADISPSTPLTSRSDSSMSEESHDCHEGFDALTSIGCLEQISPAKRRPAVSERDTFARSFYRLSKLDETLEKTLNLSRISAKGLQLHRSGSVSRGAVSSQAQSAPRHPLEMTSTGIVTQLENRPARKQRQLG